MVRQFFKYESDWKLVGSYEKWDSFTANHTENELIEQLI